MVKNQFKHYYLNRVKYLTVELNVREERSPGGRDGGQTCRVKLFACLHSHVGFRQLGLNLLKSRTMKVLCYLYININKK
jgi:hypothetical protein